MKSLFYFLFYGVLLFACNSGEGIHKSEYYEKIKSLADIYVENYLKYFPEQSTYYQLENVNYDDLTDNSLKNLKKWEVFEDSVYSELSRIESKPAVDSEAWYFYGILKEILEANIGLRISRPELRQISQIQGWHITFQTILRYQPVGNEKARNDCIKRWSKISQFTDNEIYNLKKGIQLGYTVPKKVVSIVIEQLDDILKEPYENSGFYEPAKRDSSEKFKIRWKKLLKDNIYPALSKYRNFLKDEYLQNGRESLSISALPGGIKCFEAYYRFHTSLKTNAKSIVEISEYQVKLVESKFRIKGEDQFGTDSLPIIRDKIKTDPNQYFESKEEIYDFILRTIKKAEKKCSEYFYKLPKSKLKVEVIPEIQEDQQSSFYISSDEDLTKPSVYYVNLRDPKQRLKGNIETAIFHETFPGHHLQMCLAAEGKNNYLITQLFGISGYLEGWASYAQVLAEEMGLYTTDFTGLIVSARAAQMMRLEAGIHIQNWSREKAVDYVKRNMFIRENGANQIIDRSTSWPAQYLTYGTGLIEMLELREQAMLTLGDRFDIREFHSVIMEDGALPLEMLREKVNWWLENKKSE